MSFTRLSDTTALSPTPVSVLGPFEVEREVRTIAFDLLHSATTKVTFIPVANRSGEWRLLYDTHADAKTAQTFFAVASYYTYDVTDASLDTRFIVYGGPLAIAQTDGKWVLTVPFKEVPA